MSVSVADNGAAAVSVSVPNAVAWRHVNCSVELTNETKAAAFDGITIFITLDANIVLVKVG